MIWLSYCAFAGPAFYDIFKIYETEYSAVYFVIQKTLIVIGSVGFYLFDIHERERKQNG